MYFNTFLENFCVKQFEFLHLPKMQNVPRTQETSLRNMFIKVQKEYIYNST